MNKKELKELIKPLVQECVKETIQETLLTGGLLSKIISEVVRGVAPVLAETTTKNSRTQQQTEITPETRMAEVVRKTKNIKESPERRQILDAINKTAYNGVNIFENIKETIPDEPRGDYNKPGSAFRDIDPSDPGVDIGSLFNPTIANRLLQGKKKI